MNVRVTVLNKAGEVLRSYNSYAYPSSVVFKALDRGAPVFTTTIHDDHVLQYTREEKK